MSQAASHLNEEMPEECHLSRVANQRKAITSRMARPIFNLDNGLYPSPDAVAKNSAKIQDQRGPKPASHLTRNDSPRHAIFERGCFSATDVLRPLKAKVNRGESVSRPGEFRQRCRVGGSTLPWRPTCSASRTAS